LAVEETLKKFKTDFNKCSSITTDGAKAMTGLKKGFRWSIKAAKFKYYSLHNTSGSISR